MKDTGKKYALYAKLFNRKIDYSNAKEDLVGVIEIFKKIQS
jgi:hypothetical protein